MKGSAVLLDVGGNVDCKLMHLVQFAIMGEVYVRPQNRPPSGHLSNGEEEPRATNTRDQRAHKKTSLNYIGYVEGRDIYRGDVGVLSPRLCRQCGPEGAKGSLNRHDHAQGRDNGHAPVKIGYLRQGAGRLKRR
jgi:hypothetical protein